MEVLEAVLGRVSAIRRLRVVILAAALLIVIGPQIAETGDAAPSLVLRVGVQGQMQSLNPLPSSANNVWTADVLDRAYHSVLLERPGLAKPMAYVAKGVDYDEDGTFERSEYDVWTERQNPTSLRDITVYYDFNGVRWHDGVQMTPWDLLFSYHVNAMNARFNTDIRILFAGGTSSSYESGGRQLNIELVTKNWQGESTMQGDPNLRVAVRFHLSEVYFEFYSTSLFPVMLPMHEWSVTGGLRSDNTQRHTDFGCAVWIPQPEATAKGIPECGTADSTKWGKGIMSTETVPGSHAYSYPDAEAWTMIDEDIIGNGPFEFDAFIPGVESTVIRNEDYFVGVDPDNPSVVYDPILAQRLRKPTVERIRFLVYKTTPLGAFGLRAGEIDFYHWNVGAEFASDLLTVPEVAVESSAEPGYYYMAYHFRRQPWGYHWTNGTRQDVGLVLRQAIAHLIDKESIVANLLQGFGVAGQGDVSPAYGFWHNDNIPQPTHDPSVARAILDSPEAQAVGITSDPPGPCAPDAPDRCRSLGIQGNAAFEILTPKSDYDPIRAGAGAMIAAAMRDVGLNAVARPMEFGDLLSRVATQNWDIFLSGWRMSGVVDEPTEFLWSLYRCQGVVGPNFLGYCNLELETALDDAVREMNLDRRRAFVFRAQEILAEDRPVEALYYKANVEAYLQTRFVNWTVVGGSIWNYWSLIGIRPPEEPAFVVTIDAGSWMASGATQTIEFTAREPSGRAVEGATLSVSVASSGGDAGRLAGGGSTAVVTTTGDGTGTVTYEAPLVGAPRSVTLRVSASHAAFAAPADQTAVIRVDPVAPGALRVRFGLPAVDVGYPGVPVPLRLEVRGTDGAIVSDASVSLRADPPGVDLPAAGASADLRTVTAMFSGPGFYTITANATRAGYGDGSASVTIWIVEPGPGTQPFTETHAAVDARVLVAAAISPVIAMAAALAILLRGSRRRDGS